MAANFTRLFTTLGHLVEGLDEADTYRGTTLPDRADTVNDDFGPFPGVASGLYSQLGSAQSGGGSIIPYYQTLAGQAIIQEILADKAVANPSLSACVLELNRQMLVASETVAYSPATSAVTTHLTDGDATLATTTLQADGASANLAVPDSLLFTVPRGYGNGDTAYREVLAVTGKAAVTPATRWDWPGGMGVVTSFAATDPATNVGLTNGSLANGLTGWTTDAGALTINPTLGDNPRTESSATVVSINNASGGALPARIIQAVTNIQAKTVYAWTIKIKRTTNGTSFNFNVKLVSSTLGTLSTLATVASSALTLNTWVTVTGFFVPPTTLGTGTLEVRFGSEALPTAETYHLCHVGLTPVSPQYTGGPSFIAWSGTKPLTSKDYYTAAVTIGGTGALQRGIDRLIGLRSILPNGLPSVVASTPPTQTDALVV